jgi:hypothetical protein
MNYTITKSDVLQQYILEPEEHKNMRVIDARKVRYFDLKEYSSPQELIEVLKNCGFKDVNFIIEI